MVIQIDTREKDRAIKKIIEHFDKSGVKWFSSKMYVGDYCNPFNARIVIDRKQDIREIATNATTEHRRFTDEIKRWNEIGGKVVFLITQDKIDGKPVESLEDIMLWAPKHGTIKGLTIYKILSTLKANHNIDYVFCSKRNAGKKIIELLKEVD